MFALVAWCVQGEGLPGWNDINRDGVLPEMKKLNREESSWGRVI